MGGQFSNPNANIAQEYINELTTRRARGGNPGADLPKLTLNQKKYLSVPTLSDDPCAVR